MQNEKARRTIFYSWQSDLLNATNRGFIEDSLSLAAKAIHGDDSIRIEPVIDRDIAGVPGSPDIDLAILRKIEQADIVVCDVSIINNKQIGRPTPNPNVLIECGYALKALGWECLILVMNTVYGGPRENLPFDLSRKHVVTYEMPEKKTERATERKKLAKQLEMKCREIFNHIEAKESEAAAEKEDSLLNTTINALEAQRANRIIVLQEYLSVMYEEIRRLAPDLSGDDSKNLFLNAIEQTHEIVEEFGSVVETSVMMSDSKALINIYYSFSEVARNYYLPRNTSGTFRRSDFDYYKFMGHELCVTLFSYLLREEKWEDISKLLDKDIYVDNADFYDSNVTSFEYLSKNVYHLNYIEHSDILNKRHDKPEFPEADYLLYLKSDLSDTWPKWMPWSLPGLLRIPKFISSATRISYAAQLQKIFNSSSIDELRQLLRERYVFINELYMKSGQGFMWQVQSTHSAFDYESIGTR